MKSQILQSLLSTEIYLLHIIIELYSGCLLSSFLLRVLCSTNMFLRIFFLAATVMRKRITACRSATLNGNGKIKIVFYIYIYNFINIMLNYCDIMDIIMYKNCFKEFQIWKGKIKFWEQRILMYMCFSILLCWPMTSEADIVAWQ